MIVMLGPVAQARTWGLPPTFFFPRPPRRRVTLTIEPIVIAELDALGFDLVEFKVGGSKGRPVLDVRIDRRDGAKVQVGDCERASRAIEARLDAEPGVIDARYVLEVSSPGMDRPLRTPSEWRRFAGRRATVKAAALGGRHEYEIAGVAGEDADLRITLRDAKGNEHVLGLADVDEARLAFHWTP